MLLTTEKIAKLLKAVEEAASAPSIQENIEGQKTLREYFEDDIAAAFLSGYREGEIGFARGLMQLLKD